MEITTNSLGNTVVTDKADGSFYVISVNPNDTARITHYEDEKDPGDMFALIFQSHTAALNMLVGG